MISNVRALYGAFLTQFNWSPGIGDPTVGGWITVVLYFLAAVSCWVIARKLDHDTQERRIWWSISILFLALGINKQLDLQTALTEAGRVLANFQGWYAKRRLVQLGFIVLVAIFCMIATITLLIWARDHAAPDLVCLNRCYAGDRICLNTRRIVPPHRWIHRAARFWACDGIGSWKWAGSQHRVAGESLASPRAQVGVTGSPPGLSDCFY